ncbi:multidrug and toxin extrusion protein 1-like [Nelusetta ayraudi]|uniref:multidrug and toxin extrusion protein 1-like n=1 Tax=Nelusetta ayraudi TaxID=303726 RepID=UPI003F70449C
MKSRAITVTEEMAPAQSDVSMEGLRGACVSPPQMSSTEAEPVPTDLEDSECCCWTQWWRCLKNRLPMDFWNEEVQLLKLAGPVAISQLMVFFINFVSTVFCGHLGDTELAGVAVAISLINVMGVSISTGLSSACDTLISQTYGSGNLKRVGVILQRGVLILLLACFPCCAVLLNTESILLTVRQSPKVAHVAQMYVNTFLPCLPAVFLFQLQGRYLQMQGIIWPQVITGAIGNVLNAIVNAIFLYVLDLGVVGSAAANAFSQFFLAVILFLLIYCTGLHTPTWSGWSMDCLQDWGMFIRVAIPSMIMVCMEWWMFEIGGILAGLIGEMELGAQSILHQLITILYMFPMGMGIAASARVGNALGSGNIVQAISSYKAAIICTLAISCTMGLIFGSSKDVVGYIFTTDK